MRPASGRPNAGGRLFAVRAGKIFSNLSVAALVLCLCGLLSAAAVVLFVFIAIIVVIITLGTIFVMEPDFFDKMMSAANVTAQITMFFMENFYIFASVAVGGAALSLVLLLTDRYARHTGRVVVSSVVLVFAVIVIAVFAAGGAQ